MHSRRHFLAAAGALAAGTFAGCAHPAGRLELTAVDDGELAALASRDLADTSATTRGVLERAVETGNATGAARIGTNRPVVHDGVYYDIQRSVVSTRTVPAFDVRIDYDPSSVDGPVVDYDDLPAPDRRALADLLPSSERRVDGFEVGASVRYATAEVNASVVVSDPGYEFVRYGGEIYELRVDGPEQAEVHTYRYRATERAADAAAFAAALRERYLFVLEDLTEAEREMLRWAIHGEYYAENADDETFRSLLDRLRAHDPVYGTDSGGSWLVKYDGTVYWTELSAPAFDH